jgi:hypothetical protein
MQVVGMPSSDIVLNGLTAIANDWRWLAITWHVLLAALIALLLAGWRPTVRLMGQLLMTPPLSVSLTAWLSGNPFNGVVFAILAAVLIATAVGFPRRTIRFASFAWVASGAAVVVFGWTYPHFIRTDSWPTYLYASPFGILPCPTLSAVIGMTLIFSNLGSTSWSTVLAGTGLVYGLIGVFRLGVALDAGLLLAAAALGVAVARDVIGCRSVRADRSERRRALPGDPFIAEPIGTLTHAITIACPPREVWPWLIQMGAGSRAGWYSYDVLDNGRKPSAARVVPELQDLAIGTVFPALPGVTEGFIVLALEPCRSLILGWPAPGGEPLVTWAFVLEERAGHSTRLIVRARGGQGYRFHGLPFWACRLVHFLMERKQLLGIARRVERANAAFDERALSGGASCPLPY